MGNKQGNQADPNRRYYNQVPEEPNDNKQPAQLVPIVGPNDRYHVTDNDIKNFIRSLNLRDTPCDHDWLKAQAANVRIILEEHYYRPRYQYYTSPYTDAKLSDVDSYVGYKLARVMTASNRMSKGCIALLTLRIPKQNNPIVRGWDNKPIEIKFTDNRYPNGVGPNDPVFSYECMAGKVIVEAAQFIGHANEAQAVYNAYSMERAHIVSNFDCKFRYPVGHTIVEPDFKEQGRGCKQGIHFFLSSEAALRYANDKGFVETLVHTMVITNEYRKPREIDSRLEIRDGEQPRMLNKVNDKVPETKEEKQIEKDLNTLIEIYNRIKPHMNDELKKDAESIIPKQMDLTVTEHKSIDIDFINHQRAKVEEKVPIVISDQIPLQVDPVNNVVIDIGPNVTENKDLMEIDQPNNQDEPEHEIYEAQQERKKETVQLSMMQNGQNKPRSFDDVMELAHQPSAPPLSQVKSNDLGECPICSLAIINSNNNLLTPCGHLFHANCMMDFLQYEKDKKNDNPKCPVCQLNVSILYNYLKLGNKIYRKEQDVNLSCSSVPEYVYERIANLFPKNYLKHNGYAIMRD